MTSRKGQFLVAGPRLRDPNFVRTVVLIIQHNEKGAFGLIVNRPLDVTVSDACAESVDAAQGVEQALHQGGPCEGPLMVLHSDTGGPGDEVVPGVHFTAQRDDIEQLMRADAEPVRYVANYAGWGPQQLDTEIVRGDWLLLPASAQEVFADTKTLWTRLSSRVVLGQWVRPEMIPDDPSVN
ncbi:MAG: YqgE/AlgH family protein [Tepidisphaeraceae bacterium]